MEKSGVLATSETVKPHDKVTRTSTGRRTSRSSFTISTSLEDILPRYLGASTGSCHDFCKYGKKHVFEKTDHRTPLATLDNSRKHTQRQTMVATSATKGRKKIMSKPSTKLESLDNQIAQVCKKTDVTKKKNASNDKKSTSQLTSSNTKQKKAVSSHLHPKPPLSSTRSVLDVRTQNSGTVRTLSKVKHGGGKSAKPSAAYVSTKSSVNGASNLHSNLQVDLKHASASGDQEPESFHSDKSNSEGETSSISELPPLVDLEQLSLCLSGELEAYHKSNGLYSEDGRSVSEITTLTEEDMKTTEETLKIGEFLTTADYLGLSSSESSVHCPSDLGESGMLESEDERTESEATSIMDYEGDMIEEAVKLLQAAAYTEQLHRRWSDIGKSNEPEAEVGIPERKEQFQKEQGIEVPMFGAVVHPEEVLSEEYMLKYRRGKQLELQDESNLPKTLSFKKRNTTVEHLGDNKPANPVLKATELDDPSAACVGSEMESVVLRHSQIEKRSIGALFNHVIEETANKLAETRKSKVKALVGAFETVISLQESKPSSAI